MDVTVNINAPAIVEAINKLADVLGNTALAQLTAPSAKALETAQTNENTAQPATVGLPAQQSAASDPQNAFSAVNMTSNPPPVQQTAPAAVDETYRNKVCNAAARLIEQNKMPDVLALLGSFGVQAVTQLTAAQLPAFANGLTALGAVI